MLFDLAHSIAMRTKGTVATEELFKAKNQGEPGWLSQLSVRLQLRSPSLQFVSLSPAPGSVLTAQSLDPALDAVSPSLSAPPPLMLCPSLSQK